MRELLEKEQRTWKETRGNPPQTEEQRQTWEEVIRICSLEVGEKGLSESLLFTNSIRKVKKKLIP